MAEKKPYFVQSAGLENITENKQDSKPLDHDRDKFGQVRFESVMMRIATKEVYELGGIEAYTDWVERYGELVDSYRPMAMYQALEETVKKYSPAWEFNKKTI
jgi:hypothetical protein